MDTITKTAAAVPAAPSTVTPAGMFATMTVSGATTPAAANGLYIRNGTVLGRPYYEKVSGATTYVIKWTGSAWVIIVSTDEGDYFSNPNDTNRPASSGWTAQESAAGTITVTAGTAAPLAPSTITIP